jgi:hypothetical protein
MTTKKATRSPMNMTFDPALRAAGEALAATHGIPIVRLIELSLRDELSRHGTDVEPESPAVGAVEDMIRKARTTTGRRR